MSGSSQGDPGAFASASDDARAQARRFRAIEDAEMRREVVSASKCAPDFLVMMLEQFNFDFKGEGRLSPSAPEERATRMLESNARRRPGPTLPAGTQSL